MNLAIFAWRTLVITSLACEEIYSGLSYTAFKTNCQELLYLWLGSIDIRKGFKSSLTALLELA